MPKHEDNMSGPIGNQDPDKRGLSKAQEEARKDPGQHRKGSHRDDKR